MSAPEPILSALSLAADEADRDLTSRGQYAWHRSFLAALNKQGFDVVLTPPPSDDVRDLIASIHEVVDAEEWDSSSEADERVDGLLQQALRHLTRHAEDTAAMDEIAADIARQPDCGSDFIGFVCNVVGGTGRHIASPDDDD